MKRQMFMSLIVLASAVAHAGTYKLDDAHLKIGFKVKHLVISNVDGRFNKFEGGFKFDEKTGKLEDLKVVVQANSVDTADKDRDKHLNSPDFFDTAKFKTIEFKQKDVVYKDNKPTEVKGDLTIHGVTKPVTLEVTVNGEQDDPWGNHHVGFEAHTQIMREDFGLKWNKTLDKGGVVVGSEVKIDIEGEAVLQKEAKK